MKANKIVWGIILLLAAIALLLIAFVPQLDLLGIATWKWFVGALLLFWLLKNLLFGWDLSEHLSVFLQFGLLAILFESDIARLSGMEKTDIYNNWLIMGAAILLTIAVRLIFRKKHKDGSNSRTFTARESVVYLDYSSEHSHTVRNRVGETTIFCQNTDVANSPNLSLRIVNKVGSVTVHIPADCIADVAISNRVGQVNVRDNNGAIGKVITITGINRVGEISIVSP